MAHKESGSKLQLWDLDQLSIRPCLPCRSNGKKRCTDTKIPLSTNSLSHFGYPTENVDLIPTSYLLCDLRGKNVIVSQDLTLSTGHPVGFVNPLPSDRLQLKRLQMLLSDLPKRPGSHHLRRYVRNQLGILGKNFTPEKMETI